MRNLKASEVEARVAQCSEKGCSLLLYKNARCDMAILDEAFGPFGWQRSHEFKDGKLYCTVSVLDRERNEWVSKEDVGTESNQEAEKGQASDAFKRACFNWGIGRELYTAPFIWVSSSKINVTQKNGRWVCYERFNVDVFEVTDGQVTRLEISDSKGRNVFTWSLAPNGQKGPSQPKKQPTKDELKASVEKGVEMCAEKLGQPVPLIRQLVENNQAITISSANKSDLAEMRDYLARVFKGEVEITEF